MAQNLDKSGANSMDTIRDRITTTLMDATAKMSPTETLAQTGRAAAQAATTKVTFGDALNSQKAQRMQATAQLQKFFQSEQANERSERAIDVQEKQLAQGIIDSDRNFSQSERQFANKVATSDRVYDLQTREFAEKVIANKRGYSMESQKLAQKVLSDNRKFEMNEQELRLQQAGEARLQMESAAKQGHNTAASVTNAIKALPEEVRDLYFAELGELEYEVDASNIHSAIGEVRRKLAAENGLPPVVEDKDSKARAIDRTMKANPGLTYREAQGIVDGIITVKTDPQTGNISVVNTATNQQRVLAPTLPAAQEPTPPAKGETLTEIAQTGDIAGIAPWLRETGSKLFGQAPGVAVATETIQARQTFRAEQQALVRALSLNPRFPVGEMNRIREEINIGPEAFDSQEGLLARMAGTEKALRRRLENEERAANDMRLPAKQRGDASSAANNIRDFLSVLGDPSAAIETNEPVETNDTDQELINKWLN